MTYVAPAIEIFYDRAGEPLENGYIYIGENGLDARTNPIQVYWDADMTVPAAQPIRTSAGYPTYQGAPSALYFDGVGCSITILDSEQRIVLVNLPNSFGINGTSEIVTTADFGAGTTSDDTAAFLLFLDYCNDNNVEGWIGNINISAVDYTATGDLTLHCNGLITNRDGVALDDELIRLNGDGTNKVFWRGGRINVNGGAFSGLNVYDWALAEIYLEEGWGITATTSSTNSTSMIQVDKCVTSVVRFGDIHTMDKGTNTQGSVPRVVTIQSADSVRNDSTVYGGLARNVHGVFVIGNMYGGNVNIHGVTADTTIDNGVYNVGDAAEVNLHACNFYATDEPIVNSGSGIVSAYSSVFIDQTNAIGLQNCGGVRLIGCYVKPAAGANLIKLRVDNVASTLCEVRNSVLHGRSEYAAVSFAQGSLDTFIDENNDWLIEYDSAISADNYMLEWDTGVKIFSNGSVWRLGDATGDITSAARFIQLPASLSEISHWHSRLVNETANSSAYIRINNARQQLMTFSNVRSIYNIQAEVEENFGALTTAPPREVWGTQEPSSGYWPRGSIVKKVDPSAAGVTSWVCVTAGTPGTWKTNTTASA